MAFSTKWETAYQNKKHLTRWPWTQLLTRVFTHCSLHKKGFRVLELGCGVGANIPFFKKLAVDYNAIEGSKTAVQDIYAAFPELKGKVLCGDFSKTFPHRGKFDLIFDRAALTCSKRADIERCLKRSHEALNDGGIYIGIDWYSTSNAYARRGTALAEDRNTRIDFTEGPYKGVEPIRFFSANEISRFFRYFQILELSRETLQIVKPARKASLASWHIVARK
jgi:SAM-dependent methyltransferase